MDVDTSSLGGDPPRGGPERTTTRPYSPRTEQFEAVLAFCATEWRSLNEIADAVGRAVNTVRSDYVRALATQGRLEMLFPDNPRHPGQKYRARPSDG